MTVRKTLLMSMLVVLGLCAVCGVLAVFTEFHNGLEWVIWTAVDTAVATGLLLPMTWLTSREKLRIGGLTGMGVVLLSWLWVLGALWLPELVGMWRFPWEGRMMGSMALTLLMGLPSAIVLLLRTFRWARFAVWTFAGGAALAFVLCEFGILFDGEMFIESGMIIYGLNTCAAALLVNSGCGDKRFFRWAGIAVGVAAAAMFLGNLWRLNRYDYYSRPYFAIDLQRCGAVLTVALVVMAHINLVLMAKLRRIQQWLQWCTIAISLVGGAALVFSLLYEFNSSLTDWTARIASGAGIMAACGSMALIVLTVMNRKVDAAATTPGALEATAIDIACPRCHAAQTVAFGDSTCKSCNLQFSIKVIEPRCTACGYLLYKLTGDKCPECGAPLGAAPTLAAAS